MTYATGKIACVKKFRIKLLMKRRRRDEKYYSFNSVLLSGYFGAAHAHAQDSISLAGVWRISVTATPNYGGIKKLGKFMPEDIATGRILFTKISDDTYTCEFNLSWNPGFMPYRFNYEQGNAEQTCKAFVKKLDGLDLYETLLQVNIISNVVRASSEKYSPDNFDMRYYLRHDDTESFSGSMPSASGDLMAFFYRA